MAWVNYLSNRIVERAVKLPENVRKRHREEGNGKVKCDSLYKSKKSVNCHLKAEQAVQLARNLLEKAQLLIEEGCTNDFGVHVWSRGSSSLVLYCGLNPSHKGTRRKKKATSN